jgi:hypothetical protein
VTHPGICHPWLCIDRIVRAVLAERVTYGATDDLGRAAVLSPGVTNLLPHNWDQRPEPDLPLWFAVIGMIVLAIGLAVTIQLVDIVIRWIFQQ